MRNRGHQTREHQLRSAAEQIGERFAAMKQIGYLPVPEIDFLDAQVRTFHQARSGAVTETSGWEETGTEAGFDD
jgi:hypothetical protein